MGHGIDRKKGIQGMLLGRVAPAGFLLELELMGSPFPAGFSPMALLQGTMGRSVGIQSKEGSPTMHRSERWMRGITGLLKNSDDPALP